MTTGWQSLSRFCASPAGRLVCWFGVFTALGVLDAVQMVAGQGLEDFTISWGTALRRGLESHYPMAVLGLAVLWLARRFSFDRSRVWRWAGLHLVFALGYAVAYSVVRAALLQGQVSVKGEVFEFSETFQKLIIFYTYGNVAFYGLLLLGYHGWHYYQRYREREQRAAELEGLLARAELEALRMQLNPHFLFNSLNTIAALIHEQPEAADRTLIRLSELLRLSLEGAGTHEIPLRQELGFLERYLEIERARFGDRLRVETEVEEGLRDAMVPTWVLQPIVENAIRHGVEQREESGVIQLRAVRRAELLELVVSDNGPGLKSAPAGVSREGIGLSNTRSRLRRLYGDCQELELREARGGGVEVRISLPLRTRSEPTPQPGCPAVVVGCHPAAHSIAADA